MRNTHGVYPKATRDDIAQAFSLVEQQQANQFPLFRVQNGRPRLIRVRGRKVRGLDGSIVTRLDLRVRADRLRHRLHSF